MFLSSWYTVIFDRFQMPVAVLQRKNLHIFCNHDCHFARYVTLKVKLFFDHHFLSCLSAFVDSYYSPCGPLGITNSRFYYRNAKFWAEFGYGKYLIVLFWYASAAYQARLVSPWVSRFDCVSPKYEPWLDQTLLICRWSEPKRYD